MPHAPLHPVPTVRQVFITALDKQLLTIPLETILEQRGFDLSQPYRKIEDHSLGDADLYEQDIVPPPEASC